VSPLRPVGELLGEYLARLEEQAAAQASIRRTTGAADEPAGSGWQTAGTAT
jgi:hypothetical protein